MPEPDATIRFVLDGRLISVVSPPPQMTLLEYLRTRLQRTGTKEGCAEGDCGACTVAIGELEADGERVRFRAINACIRLLSSVDGCELVTVESLRSPDGALHPVQQAMVDHHASQCGFCTPGFVMSLFVLYLTQPLATRAQVLQALSGNLCRCTGYRPIVEAGMAMTRYPESEHWPRSAVEDAARCERLRQITRGRALRFPGWHSPRSLAELAQAIQAEPNSLLLAGGTDVGLWVTKHLRELPPILYIGEVQELKAIRLDTASLTIGAAVPLTDAWAAIVRQWPQLDELAQRFGSPPVRNSGTLCGNLANGSPIGDSMPVLIALGARIHLRCGERLRSLPLEQFYLGYQKRDLAVSEFVASVEIPLSKPGLLLASYKVSKRFDQDISAVCAAFALRVDDGTISQARIAFGGMAATPKRAGEVERRLLGQPWLESSIAAAIDVLPTDFQPLSDMRASDRYRLQTAGNLLRRFYLECGSPGQALRTADVAAIAMT
jgi:xanthine dehydrogenase small subunit